MKLPIYGWIAIVGLWSGTAAAMQAPALELDPAEQAAVDACFELADEQASIDCLQALNLPLPPDMAEVLAIADDADRRAANERWQRDFDAGMVEHAHALAARADARSLLAAAMIVPRHYDQASGQPLPSAVDPQRWFDAARAARPADPLVAWLEATDCPAAALQCDANAAIARLLQVDGDNAAVQWLAIQAAIDGGDGIAARTHLRLAAQAGRFEPYNAELLVLLLDARNGASLAPMDAGTARVVGITQQLGRPATNEDIVAMQSFAQWAAFALPRTAGVMQLCGSEAARSGRDAALRQDCIGLMTQVAAEESIMIYPALALPALIGLSDGAARDSWQARLREYAWLSEQAVPLLLPSRVSAGMDEYARWIVSDGETGAMRRLMRHHGIPLEPPAGWLPKNRRYRALVTTGVAPAG